jgi:uracil-DNA glycosylase family 4
VPGLEDLHARVASCTDCDLYKSAINAVPGEGSPRADLMFIGEGPGAKEDALGRPFVGPAGQVLNQLLASIGLKREDVYISNMVKHRPPDNRDPLPGEIQACAKYLEEQIKLINPKVVIPLGRHALAKWFPKDTISKVHGRPRRLGELTLFPQYHPAAVLHNPTIRPALERDFQEMGKLLHQDDIPAEPETTEELDGQQLSML